MEALAVSGRLAVGEDGTGVAVGWGVGVDAEEQAVNKNKPTMITMSDFQPIFRAPLLSIENSRVDEVRQSRKFTSPSVLHCSEPISLNAMARSLEAIASL